MGSTRTIAAVCLLVAAVTASHAREWTDATNQYHLDAEFVAHNGKTIVLKRADRELVAVPLDSLSDRDRDYLKSKDAEQALRSTDDPQSWTLQDGTKLKGRLVDYCSRDVTIQRRRGHIFVNDRRLSNLPQDYRNLIPQFVAHYENLESASQAEFENWVLRQRGQARTFHLKGIVIELEDGNEYFVPFFLLSEEDREVLGGGWNAWEAARRNDDEEATDEATFLLQALAAARYQDQKVNRQIALMNLKLGAVQAGLTSLWEVTLYPRAAHFGPPRWVVVPGRNSDQAAANALNDWPGFDVGSIRRVSR